MFLTQSAIAQHPRLMGHYQEVQANRAVWAAQQEAMNAMYNTVLAPNQSLSFSQSFWAEIDAQVVDYRDRTRGMEILTDLMPVQTVLPVGKTAKLYDIAGDIADDVAVSIDGQAPFSFDHASRASDGDPVPVFTAGYGVNWRLVAGLETVGIDAVLEAQAAKLEKFNRRLVSYLLDGDPNIVVSNYEAQGLRTHRNTAKLNLGSGTGGANIDLTTATQVQLASFFSSGAFGQAARDNAVMAYDVLWVSPQIYANLMKPSMVQIGGTDVPSGGTVLSQIMGFIPAREVRQTFALNGNELLAYERDRQVVSPLVGMATNVTPLPRPTPNSNFNFQITAAMGVQVKRDGDGRSGVLYAANLD